jgi:hypothetical protein
MVSLLDSGLKTAGLKTAIFKAAASNINSEDVFI